MLIAYCLLMTRSYKEGYRWDPNRALFSGFTSPQLLNGPKLSPPGAVGTLTIVQGWLGKIVNIELYVLS